MNCLFCKIIKKEISAEIIYEDKNVVAVLDAAPIALGHAMVLPKTHAENILDLDDKLTGPVFLAVKKVVNLLNRSLKPGGFTIGINHGRVSGQAIDHLHIHIVPRWQNDGGYSIHGIVKNPPHESVQETADKIKGQQSL